MKRIAIVALSVMAASAVFAQTDATLNSVTEKYTLKSDGAIDYDYSKSMTFHSNYSFFSLFGETFIVYNPEFQKLKINDAYTVQKDGTRINFPANAFNEVLPSGAANSAAYNGLKEMVVTQTGLEAGATSYLSYTLTGTPEGTPTLDYDKVIAVPGANIKNYVVSVTLPEGKKLNWSLTGSNVKPVVKGNTYTWTFTNIPAASVEALAASDQAGIPHLAFTTAGSLEEALRPLTMETRDICRVPQQILKDKATPEQKIEAVQSFIINNIALGQVDPALTAYALRQCNDVLESAFATEPEKAAAMAKMLRGEGIDAQMVVMIPKSTDAKSIPSIKKYLVKADGKYYSAAQKGEFPAALYADRNDFYDLGGTQQSVAASALTINASAQIAVSAKGAELKSSDCKVTPSGMSAKVAGAGKVEKAGDYYVYTLPGVSGGVDALGLSRLNSQRKTAVEIKYPVAETCEYTLQLSGLKAAGKSNSVSLSNSAGSVEMSVKAEGDKVTVKRAIKLSKSVYAPADYKALQALMKEWNSTTWKRIVLK